MDRGAWWATVHGVTKDRTRLSDFSFTFTFSSIAGGFFTSEGHITQARPASPNSVIFTSTTRKEGTHSIERKAWCCRVCLRVKPTQRKVEL